MISHISLLRCNHANIQVPARSFAVVARTIEQETGRPVHETFSEFDPTPLGSASIGQVHRARLKSNGQHVAVKVQYPEVRVRCCFLCVIGRSAKLPVSHSALNSR